MSMANNRINPEGLNYDDFVKDYVETVKGLLQNKKNWFNDLPFLNIKKRDDYGC